MQFALYYVSDSSVLVSTPYNQGSWDPDPALTGFSSAIYSTAKDTRSLSMSSLANGSSDDGDSTVDLALLYYENPTGTVSALLQQWNSPDLYWTDITGQRNDSSPNDGSCNGSTLYACNTIGTFSTPFTSAANYTEASVGALFFLPSNTSGSGGTIVNSSYSIGTGFLEGMYRVSSCSEQSFKS